VEDITDLLESVALVPAGSHSARRGAAEMAVRP
jgi:hypothetical protein